MNPSTTNTNNAPGTRSGKKVARISGPHQERYWASKVFRTKCVKKDVEYRSSVFSVRLQHLGKRKLVCLETPDKAEAARKAKHIYCTLVANAQGMPDDKGWDRVLKAYRPEMLVKKNDVTVGDYLQAIREKNALKEQTLFEYSKKLRQIAAGVAKVSERAGARRNCYRGPNAGKWRELVDNVTLSVLTDDAVNAWIADYLSATAVGTVARTRAQHTVDSLVRNARSLFTSDIVTSVSSICRLKLIPFTKVKLQTKGLSSYRFKATLDPIKLLRDARAELREVAPELYKIFILALGGGLRRGEIDRLRTESLLSDRSQITVFDHDHFAAKSEYSKDSVDVEQMLIQELLALQKPGEAFVVPPKKIPEKSVQYRHYWSAKHFKALCAWLRSKGINEDKPIHTLRKYFGCMMNDEHGIYVASKALRHSSVAVTASYYVDKTKRRVPSIFDQALPKDSPARPESFGSATSVQGANVGTPLRFKLSA